MIFSIYKITNIVNQKVYIGFTQKTIQQRLKKHLQEAHNKNNNRVLLNAIRKYGSNNFVTETLATFNDREKALNAETYYIKKHNSHYIDGYGYNMSYGGEGNPSGRPAGWIHSEETREKISKSNKQRIVNRNHNFTSAFSKEYNAKRIAAGTHNFVSNNPSKGKVVCRDKTGNVVQVPSNVYKAQTGPKEQWEYVANGSKEATRRKALLS